MTELLAGEVMTSVPTGAVTVNAKAFALPSTETLTLALPAVNPETTVDTTPEVFVLPLKELNPNTNASVEAKVTGTPAKTAPLASFTVALKVIVLPPAVKALPPELATVSVAPLTCTGTEEAAAKQEEQLAVTVATRVT